MQEIIIILIIATIPIVGLAILFWIVRLCKILNQTNRDREISRLIQERDTLIQDGTPTCKKKTPSTNKLPT